MDERWGEIRSIHRQFRAFYEVSGGFTIIMLLLLVGAILFANGVLNDYSTNVFTEIVSAVASVIVTVLILDRRAEAREEKRRLADLKAQLVREAGSPDHASAINAVRALAAQNWLRGDHGALQGAYLYQADLQGADLVEANLQGAELAEANLHRAFLEEADLQDASLQEADLQGTWLAGANLTDANLREANLQGAHLENTNLNSANLYRANLQGVSLMRANLEGANLCLANLQDAKLTEAKFSDSTVLPDAEWDEEDEQHTSCWTPDTDMTRFTDPNHLKFWKPEQTK